MYVNHVFYKNCLLTEIESRVAQARQKLIDELIAAGSDPVVYRRRIRMLQQLSTWHAQIINKLFAFESDDPADYLEIRGAMIDLHSITSRNA
jgi:hypothetical protein